MLRENTMSSTTAIILLLALFVKHFILTFIVQTSEQLSHKVSYFSKHSLIFSLYHIIGTITVLSFVVEFSLTAIIVATTESILRHHIDWMKANIINMRIITSETAAKMWWILGFDQWLHCAVYVGVVWFFVRS